MSSAIACGKSSARIAISRDSLNVTASDKPCLVEERDSFVEKSVIRNKMGIRSSNPNDY